MRWLSLLVIFVLASCWNSPAPNEPIVRKPRRVLHVKPTCWTPQWFEIMPEQRFLWDVSRDCGISWTEAHEIANCVALEIEREYQRLWGWVHRWFDACDPRR